MYRKIIMTSLVIFLLFACSSTYYGYTKAEWDVMPKEKQIVAIEEFKKLEQERHSLVHGDARDNATEAFTERALGTH